MKKFLSCLMALVVCIMPAVLFSGCKNKDNARDVKNRTYYVTLAKRDTEDITQSMIDSNFRISFFTDNFKVEQGNSSETATYGYYLGTYKTTKESVTLTINEYGGTFKTTSTSLKDKVFTSFRYEKGKLKTEFVNNGHIMQYVLELPPKAN